MVNTFLLKTILLVFVTSPSMFGCKTNYSQGLVFRLILSASGHLPYHNEYTLHKIPSIKGRGGVAEMAYAAGAGVAGAGLYTTTGTILVLFILLVIISRTIGLGF
jgi:hypothetical protein